MQMKEKLAYAFLLHFSALMIVFLMAGITQLFFSQFLMEQAKTPVISAMISIARQSLDYPLDKIVIGMITFVFFIPLDLSILYFVTKELFEKGDIYNGIEDGIRNYPLFIVFISDLYFFSFVYPWFAPFVLLIMFRYLEPDIELKTHIVSTVLIGSWLLPLSLIGGIRDIVLRNAVSLGLYLALAFPFFVHAWMVHDIRSKNKSKREIKSKR